MANSSIYAAFERMWQQVVALTGTKASIENVEASLTEHNVAVDAHNDIRLLVDGLTTRLNAVANSTDTDLDQLAELVEYIKDNRELIEGVTTNKVNVSDIIDNLTTNVANKPLSAARGVALKAQIDAIEVPTKVSDLTNDSGFITSHQDISGKLDKSGGTMTGALTLAADPTENLQAATKQYVDTKAPAYTYGTADMTAGSSALETGKLYFVYE